MSKDNYLLANLIKRWIKMIKIILGVLLFIYSCSNVNNVEDKKEVITLKESKTHADSVLAIDQNFVSEFGNVKPPCSCSPCYEECMQARIEKLGLKGFQL